MIKDPVGIDFKSEPLPQPSKRIPFQRFAWARRIVRDTLVHLQTTIRAPLSLRGCRVFHRDSCVGISMQK